MRFLVGQQALRNAPHLIARQLLPGLILVALSLSCRGSETPQPPAPDHAPGRVQITYWEKWSGFEFDAMKVLVDNFNSSQDRIHVNLVHMTDIRTKLLLATAGGNPPDVAGFFPDMMIKCADRSALMPLNEVMARDGISPDRYLPSVIALCEYRDFYWGLPTTPASSGLFYNKRLFREAGLDPERPPRTIDELTGYSERLTRTAPDGRITHLGFTPMDPPYYKAWYGWWFGAGIWDGDSSITLESEEWQRCLRWIRSFPEAHGRDELLVFQQGGGSFGSEQNLFIAEKIAMQHNGVWMANFINQFNPKMEWGAAPFPSDDENLHDITFVDTDILVIPKGSKHPNEAWEFIKYVQQQENLELLCVLHRKFSPLKEVTPEFYERNENKYSAMFRHLAESENARPIPMLPIVEEIRDEVYLAVDKVWLLEETPMKALETADIKLQRLLDRNIRQWDRVENQRTHEWSNAWKELDE